MVSESFQSQPGGNQLRLGGLHKNTKPNKTLYLLCMKLDSVGDGEGRGAAFVRLIGGLAKACVEVVNVFRVCVSVFLCRWTLGA